MSDRLAAHEPIRERPSIASVALWWRLQADTEPDPDLAATYHRLADELDAYNFLRWRLT